MDKDIVLFYYYSSPTAPDGCFLGLSNDIAYRNMFLFPCPDNKIHFEFPIFEDHSYNSICNLLGVKKLIKRPGNRKKYIVFRTESNNVIGFYRVLRAYYQETNMFDDNGFVWGLEAEPYLIKKGSVKYDGPRLRQGYKASWQSSEWAELLAGLLGRIQTHKNLSGMYRSETIRLIELFKDSEKMKKWEERCLVCTKRSECTICRKFNRYNREHPGSNMFVVLNKIYNSNVYSRDYLCEIPKIYLK